MLIFFTYRRKGFRRRGFIGFTGLSKNNGKEISRRYSAEKILEEIVTEARKYIFITKTIRYIIITEAIRYIIITEAIRKIILKKAIIYLIITEAIRYIIITDAIRYIIITEAIRYIIITEGISSSCHEQVCFTRLRFETYFSHHRAV